MRVVPFESADGDWGVYDLSGLAEHHLDGSFTILT
jgi:hypothetical protein